MSKLLDQVSKETQAGQYGGFKIKSMAGYTPERIQWLWPDMIAKGILHVFAGDSGIGKTMLLCDISAIVSRGGIFPGQKERCEAGKVVYLSGEDGLNHTIGPRLEAAGADMEQMLELPPLNNQGKLFDLSTDVDFITDHLLDIGGVSLFIIDPVTAFCGGRFDNDSVTSVRSITLKLGALAESTGIAIIALQHLTKSSQSTMKYRILGSGAWVQGPRIVLGGLVTSDDHRLFGKVKANITDTNGVYPFSIERYELRDIGDVRRIEWGEECWFDNQLSEFEGEFELSNSKGQLVYDILKESLSDGEWRSRDFLMKKILTIVEVHDSTVARMAEELGIEKRRTKEVPPRTEWRIPKPFISVHKE